MPELTAGGRTVWVRRGSAESEDGQPTLLFVHGAGASSLTWIYQIRALRRRVRCIALDLPGHGKSPDDSSCASVASYANVIADVARNLPKPLILIGHSMGGAIVLETIASHDLAPSAAILFGTGPRIPVSPLLLEALQQDSEVWVHLMDDLLFSPTTPRRFVDKSTASGLQAPRPVVLRDFESCAVWQLGQDAAIGVPSLVISGVDDAMVPAPLSEALAMTLSESTFELIDDAGHMAMLEQHKRVNEILLDFVLAHLAVD